MDQAQVKSGTLQWWLLSLAGTAIVAAGSYQWLDRPIARFFPRTVEQHEALAHFARIPNPLLFLAVAAFFGVGVWILSGRELSRLLECAVLSSISLTIAEITKSLLKWVFGRPWPDTWTHNNASFLRDGAYGFHFFHGGTEYASFPSGHMAVTCAVVSVLWIYYPRLRALYVIGAVAMAIGLIASNYHFLSDIIAGSFVGVSSGWFTTALWKVHRQAASQ